MFGSSCSQTQDKKVRNQGPGNQKLFLLPPPTAQSISDTLLAYRFTGRQKFARQTAELLAGYSKKYLTYPRHDNNGKDTVTAGRIGSQTLDEATWLIPVTWAYALIGESLDNNERDQIESGLLLPATETIIGPSFERLPKHPMLERQRRRLRRLYSRKRQPDLNRPRQPGARIPHGDGP